MVQNGATVIDHEEIPGITGGALDSHEGVPGPIYLQGSEERRVAFRNIVITPAIWPSFRGRRRELACLQASCDFIRRVFQNECCVTCLPISGTGFTPGYHRLKVSRYLLFNT